MEFSPGSVSIRLKASCCIPNSCFLHYETDPSSGIQQLAFSRIDTDPGLNSADYTKRSTVRALRLCANEGGSKVQSLYYRVKSDSITQIRIKDILLYSLDLAQGKKIAFYLLN